MHANYCISELIPHAKDILLKSLSEKIKMLNLIDFFYCSLQDTIMGYQSALYSKFDAHVGETLCQARAYILANLLKEGGLDETIYDLYKFSKVAKGKIADIQAYYNKFSNSNNSRYKKGINDKISLGELLENQGLTLNLSSSVFFLIQCHILSRHKLAGEYSISFGINYDSLCSAIGITSKTYIRKLVHHLQRNVSNISSQFVLETAYKLGFSSEEWSLLKLLHQRDEVGRHLIACYELTNVILKHSFTRSHPIQVIVFPKDSIKAKLSIVLMPCQRTKKYKLIEDDAIPPKECMIFTGITSANLDSSANLKEYIKRFLDIGFHNIILMNMADHPQYAGLLLTDKKYNPYLNLRDELPLDSYKKLLNRSEMLFLRCKNKATIFGCTRDNTNLFLLKHVYFGEVNAISAIRSGKSVLQTEVTSEAV